MTLRVLNELMIVSMQLYAEYETALRESNSLDFDDLLVFGLRLFREVPKVLESCRHILVDEFQVSTGFFEASGWHVVRYVGR